MSENDMAARYQRDAALRARAPFLNLNSPPNATPEVAVLLDARGCVLRHDETHPDARLPNLSFPVGQDIHSVFHPDCGNRECEFLGNWNAAWNTHRSGVPVEWIHHSDGSHGLLKIRLQPVAYARGVLFDGDIEDPGNDSVMFIRKLAEPGKSGPEAADNARVINSLLYAKTRSTHTDLDLVASADDRLRTVTHRLLDARDAVRNQLAEELHDSLGQTLGLLRLAIESAVVKLGPIDGSNEPLQMAAKYVVRAQRQLRRVTKRLHSKYVDATGLVESLQGVVADFRAMQKGTELTVDLGRFRRDVPTELGIAIYRIVQESLNNVMRHSDARNASLTLESDKNGVRLVVKDDGVGLPSSGPVRQGLGLITMRERAERIGGHYETHCPEGDGCTISVTWTRETVDSMR